VFIGAHYHSVDDKGRVIIPQRFRTGLGNTFIITKGFNKCLFVYKESDFLEMAKKLQAQPALDPHAERLQRWFFGEASEAQADNQGRVAIPSSLRDFAHIENEAVLSGGITRVEIWSRTAWDAYNAAQNEDEIRVAAAHVGLAT